MSIADILQSGLNFSTSLTNFTESLCSNASLYQNQTNGDSLLGTLSLPDYNSSLPFSDWGSLTASNANPYTQSPNTGQVRSYDFTIHRGVIAPDGYQKHVLLINNQFPGPTIEANWGDTITVNVHNALDNSTDGPEEGTALHWHGLLQAGNPWEDGVPAIGQCPIAPGKSLQYSFKADLYGTSWYHSHYSAQYAGGLFGPMIIHGPSNADYDVDVGPVLISDWFHKQYYDLVQDIMGTEKTLVAPKSDNNLINGKMDFDCSLVKDGTPCTNRAGLAKFKFTKGKKHRLRLINASAEALQKFSIDNHNMTVIANDFVPVVPYDTNVVTLGVGQRTDVIVDADGDSNGIYWMRSTISNCSNTLQPDAQAIIYYEDADTSQRPRTSAWPLGDDDCANVRF